MDHRIEVKDKKNIFDAMGEGLYKAIGELGIKGVDHVEFIQVFNIYGKPSKRELKIIARDLLTDPVTQEHKIDDSFVKKDSSKCHVVEIAYNPGVMDPVEESAFKGVMDLKIKSVTKITTGKKYIIYGKISKKTVEKISEKLLYNKITEHAIHTPKDRKLAHPATYKFKLTTVDLLKASNKKLTAISKEGQLFLNLEEMQTIQKYFTKLKRNPTDIELETIAQTWSEHCKHKTLRGNIEHNGEKINNLLKSTIMKVTKELNKKWCVSVFKDNAGIISFDDKYDLCFKVETHNHPSALEPYGGSGTGIGGVIRDILGTGLGGKPVMNTDIFCFGEPDMPMGQVPKGALHPRRVMRGVVSGVRDYGNRMGIPTANGSIVFDNRYTGNPLVYCGTVGLIPRKMSEKAAKNNDLIVVVGGRTGCDGIHGATFSSGELTEESETVSSQAVQIGNPIMEKKVTDTLIQARDMGLYTAVTDCGAGGLSSAVGEMGEHTGAEVYLEKIPLKYQGLSYTEMWISEAQERMVFSVPKNKLKKFLAIFNDENVEATVIGKYTDTKRLKLFYDGTPVGDLDMKFMHDGDPKTRRKSVWKTKKVKDPVLKRKKSFDADLLNILNSWNVCSKEWVIRQYDHEVQGASVLKPLQGINCDGPGDAAVSRPVFTSKKGFAVSNGINPIYGCLDPYRMAASVIDEAIRQIVSVGGDPDKIALLDNYCWGNTNKPSTLGSLVEASKACYDIAKVYGTPFISGKDSLNNEFKTNKETIAIPPTLLISAIGLVNDVEKVVSMDLKSEGSRLYVLGETFNEMGGSHYFKVNNYKGGQVPNVDPLKGKKLMKALHRAIEKDLILSCHDCSEGGIAVAVAEMSFAGNIGIDMTVSGIPAKKIKKDEILLFSESNTRFIVEVSKDNVDRFEKHMSSFVFGLIGETKSGSSLRVEGLNKEIIIDCPLDALKDAWKKPFSKW